MNCIKYFLLIALCGSFTIVSAQDPKGQDGDLYKENYDLQKELRKREEQIKELEKKLAKTEAEKNRADSLLEVEKAVGKSKEVKTQLKELEQANKKLKDSLENCSANVEKAVSQQAQQYNRQILDLQEQIQKLQEQLHEDSTIVASLNQKLQDLSGFRERWLAELAESVNEKWLDKLYSEINVTELESTLREYEEFASADNRIKDASKKLKTLLVNCRIYEQGVNAVNSRYNANVVNSIKPSVKSLRDQTSDPDKKKEVALLFWQLDNYGVTVEIFQDVIKAVDEQIAGQVGGIWSLVKAELEKQEQENEYITAIKKIPWLEKQYNAYLTAMKNNVKPNPVRDDILKIIP